MAKMIDQKPYDYEGEAKVWQSISDYMPGDVVAYNNREVNGREYDFCLLMENMGILVIEVKGWVSSKVTVNGIDEIVIEGYDRPQRSPKKQARAYRFAILGKISQKYNVSPLVYDMVCYPFISEDEYYSIKLDIVSEPSLTIFKEDLESEQALRKKINQAYKVADIMPHADFSYDLMLKIRHDLEPDLIASKTGIKECHYSELSIIPGSVDVSRRMAILEAYFEGTKQILFIDDKDSFAQIVEQVDSEFKKRNMDAKGNNLTVGYDKGVKKYSYDASFRIFNFELYLIPRLLEITSDDILIVEGKLDSRSRAILNHISKCCNFNIEQYGVEHATTEKNVLVEAGAGTGKTYSMVSRIAYLCNKVDHSVSSVADEIAMITFTNEAAINMKKRLKQMFINYFILTGDERFLKYVEDVDRSNISTIHKFVIEILRKESIYTGLGTNFKISTNEYDREKIYDVYLSQFLENMEEDNSNFANELPVPVYDLKKKIMGIADRLLDKSIDFDSISELEMGTTVENNIPYMNELIKNVVFMAEREYLDGMKQYNKIDLKECIIVLNKILAEGRTKLDNYHIRYLFIDEFQDTDDVQIELFLRLQKAIKSNCRLFVVGDLKQSIYRFRGAKLSAFTKLKGNNGDDWDIHKLNINYRTDSRLLDLYDEIFQSMGSEGILPYTYEKDRLLSEVCKEATDDELLVCVPCHAKDDDTRYETIIGTIKAQKAKLEMLMADKELKKEERTIAVLVRNNWQVDKVLKAAEKDGGKLNVEIKTGGDLFQLDSTIDFYKLVTALCNSTNPVYLVNLIESNYTDLKLDYSKLRGLSETETKKEIVRVLDEFFVLRMGKTWNRVVSEVHTQPVLFVLKQIYEALRPWKQFSRQFDRQKFYMANYEYLLEKIIKFSRVDALTLNQINVYLRINILTGQRQMARTVESDDKGVHIVCTTVHKSKGLEYATVILPFTDDDIGNTNKVKLEANYVESKLSYVVQFENKIRESNSNYSDPIELNEQIAEESRILYVALTRAIKNCIWIKNIDDKSPISWGSILEG